MYALIMSGFWLVFTSFSITYSDLDARFTSHSYGPPGDHAIYGVSELISLRFVLL